MVLPIVHYNDPVLRKKGARIDVFDSALAQFAKDLDDSLRASDNGIGLAAQQVGRAVMVCEVDVRGTDPDFDWLLDGAKPPLKLFMPLFMVNPEITRRGDEKTVYEEGCLSFPGIRGDVQRPDEIEVVYQDLQGVKHLLHCNGILSRCIQHEVDHLNGTLFIDRMDKRTRGALERSVKALAQQTREAAEGGAGGGGGGCGAVGGER